MSNQLDHSWYHDSHELAYYHDPGGLKWRARAERIDELSAAGGSDNAFDRGYWEMVYDNEEAPNTTDARELAAAGFETPPASSMDDDALTAKLADLIVELEKMAVVLFDHEHLTPRELYECLVGQLLHIERPDVPTGPGGGWTIDVALSTGHESEELMEME